MYPILLQIGELKLRAYTVFAVAAMLGSMFVVRSEARRLGWNVRAASWLVVQCTLIGFVGAHVLYAITRLELPSEQWWRLFWRFGYGGVWFGGFILSWGWCEWWRRQRNVPRFQMYDVAAFAVLIALPIGRLGCFFNGCCYGSPTGLPWAMWLPTREYGFAGLHPTAIYEMLYSVAVFAFLWSRRKRAFEGEIASTYLILAPVGRFLLEFLRGDTVRGFIFASWMSTSQLIALGLAVCGVLLRFYLKKKTS